MAIDDVYDLAVQKGNVLLQLMLADDRKAGQLIVPPRESVQSNFTALEDMDEQGFEGEVTEACVDNMTIAHLAPILKALGVEHKMACDGGRNRMVKHIHSQVWSLGGTAYPPTQATHIQVCNPTDGVLIAHSNHSAAFMGAFQDPPVHSIPPLRHWSDIAYLQWLAASVSSPSITVAPAPIRYILRLSIHHPPTYSVLNKMAAKQSSKTYDVWPGVTFDIASDEGKAILGTPHGAGVAWMLIQRKKELGKRRIEKVTMFYAEGGRDMFRWPSLLFWIV